VRIHSVSTSSKSLGPLRTLALCPLILLAVWSPRAGIRAEPAAPLQTSAPAGLVAHWPLNEGSGPLAEDLEGGYTATLSNGATWTTGRLGSGVALDGIDGYIAPPIIDVPGNALTLAAWVRVNSFSGTSEQRIISKSTGSSKQGSYWTLSVVRSGRKRVLGFNLRAGGSTTTLTAPTGPLTAGTWFHTAAIYDGSTMRLYLNGVEVGRLSKTGTIATNPIVPADIGRSPAGEDYLRGAIDDVRIYSRALTAVEVGAVMEDPGGEEPPPDPEPDTTAPSVPGGLQASALSSTSVSLRWNVSTDNVGVAGYRVTRNGMVVATVTGTTHTDAGLTASTAYTYRVSAYDEAGNVSADSAAATVTTQAGTPAPNQPPTVALTVPANGATFLAPASFTVAASAADPENRLSDVRFYLGGVLVGTDTTAPYSVGVTGIAVGTYALTAVARDSDGASATSPAVTINVNAATPTTWRVAFTASADHSTNVTSYVLEVFANGANPDTATPLATSDLGKPAPTASNEIIVDRTTLLGGLAPGSYVITIRAIGPGGSTRSAPYTFTR
jgi:chitodextrinase